MVSTRLSIKILTLTSILVASVNSGESQQTIGPVEQALPDTTGTVENDGPTASWSEVVAEVAAAESWLKTFNDPELEKIVAEALRNNRQLVDASVNLDAATQFALQARAALVNAASVGGGDQVIGHRGARAGDAGVTLDPQWEIDIWDRLAPAAAAAEDYRVPTAVLEGARLSLIAKTARVWYLANEANLQLALSQNAIDIYQQALGIVETRAGTGAASPQDVSLARSDLSAANDRQLQAVSALVQALRSVAAVLGRFPSAELAEARDFVPVPPPVPVGIPAVLLERRPDLVTADRQVAAAFQRLESVKAAKLPSLLLTAAGSRPSRELIDLVGDNSDFFSDGANFIAVLDIGGKLETRVRIETARQNDALANYAATALKALREVEYGLTKEALLLEREALLAAAAEESGQALAAAQSRHGLGAGDLLGVLQMQARELNSRILLVRIKNARLAQRIDLHLALGGDFEAPEPAAQ